jgi:Family of unknown function (DUF6312)
MDRIVRRVTVIERGGQHHKAKIVYNNNDDDDDDDDSPHFGRLERSVRHALKAQVVAAQEAYQRHLDSAAKGGNAWIHDGPRNLMRARRKALKEMRLAGPFGMPRMRYDEDEED